jgi:membrane protein DedA with SNARE-associated domain
LDPITPHLAELLTAYGPWLLFGMAVLETSFVTGLLVPSGLATALATVLALGGALELRPLILAALTGGLLGDSMGFWIGRAAGSGVFSERGRLGRLLGPRHREVTSILGRHPFYSVTLARLLSFVRTLMPMAAGMSRLPYGRFLVYEIPGVVAWACLYVGIGYVARESWHVATQILGVGGAAALVGVGLFLWWGLRRRVRSGGVAARENAS